jgi:hypothetical protein
MTNFLKKITSLISFINFKIFITFASFASIFGVALFFIKEKWATIFALSFTCLMLLAFTTSLIYALFKIIDTRTHKYDSKSTFVKFEATSKKLSSYEVYKLIQSKEPITTELEYPFKWSGTFLPVITSNLQTVFNVVDEKESNKYDKAILKFKKPVYFNEDYVIHFKAEINDSDNKGLPYVQNRIKQDVDIIHYRVILKYKSNRYNKNAILERQELNTKISDNFEKIADVSFDNATKSYEYHLLNPEIGFLYRLSWEK